MRSTPRTGKSMRRLRTPLSKRSSASLLVRSVSVFKAFGSSELALTGLMVYLVCRLC